MGGIHKFFQNKTEADKLTKTTGILVEATGSRKWAGGWPWGDARYDTAEKLAGNNEHGQILMKIRSELKQTADDETLKDDD